MRVRSWTIALLALVGCSDDARAATDEEILERLARIENRITALERRDREPATRVEPVADPVAAQEPVRDPMQAAPAASAPSVALSVTRTGWQVDGKPVDAAQLRVLLHGVASVTINASIDAPQASLVDLLDLLREAEITKVAIVRPSLDRGWADSE